MAKKRKGAATPAGESTGSAAYEVARELGLALPGVRDSTSYGTPALKVRGKLIARLREDGESLALRIGFPEREELLHRCPDAFYVTEHYLSHPSVIVRLAKVRRDVLAQLLADTWRQLAPKSWVTKYDAAGGKASQVQLDEVSGLRGTGARRRQRNAP